MANTKNTAKKPVRRKDRKNIEKGMAHIHSEPFLHLQMFFNI